VENGKLHIPVDSHPLGDKEFVSFYRSQQNIRHCNQWPPVTVALTFAFCSSFGKYTVLLTTFYNHSQYYTIIIVRSTHLSHLQAHLLKLLDEITCQLAVTFLHRWKWCCIRYIEKEDLVSKAESKYALQLENRVKLLSTMKLWPLLRYRMNMLTNHESFYMPHRSTA